MYVFPAITDPAVIADVANNPMFAIALVAVITPEANVPTNRAVLLETADGVTANLQPASSDNSPGRAVPLVAGAVPVPIAKWEGLEEPAIEPTQPTM